MKATLSFNNNQAEKDTLDKLILSHEIADNFRQGIIWDENAKKGCSIGCINHDYSHRAIAEKYGVPLFFVNNAETIFEGLPVDKSKTFTRKYWRYVPVGANDDYFKSLYHFICANQIKKTLVNLKSEELTKILTECLNAHCKKSDEMKDLKDKLLSYSYANLYDYVYTDVEANAYANTYANTFVNACISATINANASAYAYAYAYAYANPSAYAHAVQFTMEITIKGLQMTKTKLDNFLLKAKI